MGDIRRTPQIGVANDNQRWFPSLFKITNSSSHPLNDQKKHCRTGEKSKGGENERQDAALLGQPSNPVVKGSEGFMSPISTVSEDDAILLLSAEVVMLDGKATRLCMYGAEQPAAVARRFCYQNGLPAELYAYKLARWVKEREAEAIYYPIHIQEPLNLKDL